MTLRLRYKILIWFTAYAALCLFITRGVTRKIIQLHEKDYFMEDFFYLLINFKRSVVIYGIIMLLSALAGLFFGIRKKHNEVISAFSIIAILATIGLLYSLIALYI